MHRASLCFVALGVVGCGDNLQVGDPVGDPVGDAAPDPSPDAPVPASCIASWHDLQRGGDAADQVWGMTIDRDGGVYLAGYEQGITGVTNIEPTGNARGVVLAYDRDGAPRWKALVDTAATDTVEDVAIDPISGDLVTVGRTSGAFPGFFNGGQFDIVVAELDHDGRIGRVVQTGDSRPQHPTRLDVAPDHRIAIAGYDDMFVEGNAVLAVEGGFISAVDGDSFTPTFFRKIASTRLNEVTDVVAEPDASGAMYVTRFVTSPPDDAGAYVDKLGPTGLVQWSTKVSPVGVDPINAIAIAPDGDVVATGATSVLLGDHAFGQQDAFVARLDRATGDIRWLVQAGAQTSDYPTSIALDAAGNIYIAGETLNIHLSLDLFAMRFDPTGKLTSTWHGGSTDSDFITSMVVDPCGTAIVGGYTVGAIVDGATAHGSDMFAIRAEL